MRVKEAELKEAERIVSELTKHASFMQLELGFKRLHAVMVGDVTKAESIDREMVEWATLSVLSQSLLELARQ